ncbi:helix-turn-helix domain-containing protein [Geobacillus thermodenitrificans]|jgi:transposase|uniref:Helix-turn-helix domain-containing protein n=2 Tax=Anoxybacillaceae TaxID=3120669 RepID=A0ABY9QH58_GEOTD|nr:helix-turn-helix domain-containing protein [Geobacillus thermodenitrificans]NNU88612.1 helix-turn-helix domain-containing protein [Geobacillus sp. MR]PJW20732.1 helix-turn-helix domain-containing protein [Geobacillus thermodenitrificans]PTR47946.1 helix-turn-helix domain-containing protein [Geobacillus thermodenitrificans]WMV77911.1 helix-turn-helix domain-containing protein [Geobacillus thermodenitrificans]
MSHFKSSQIEANILFFYRQRVMVVRLVMEGDLGKEAASMVNVCRQTVSHSVSLFNEGGLDLSSGFRPRTRAVSH